MFLIKARAPSILREAIKAAAEKELTTPSEWMRRALLRQLREAGIDPRTISQRAARFHHGGPQEQNSPRRKYAAENPDKSAHQSSAKSYIWPRGYDENAVRAALRLFRKTFPDLPPLRVKMGEPRSS